MNYQTFYNKTINKKELKSIIHLIFNTYGIVKTTKLVDNIKKSGFSFATQAGVSISIEDLKVPLIKKQLFKNNNKDIKLTYLYEKRGSVNEVERFQKVIDSWHNTSELLKEELVKFFNAVDPLNPVYMMAFSGARGNISQVRQLIGMRGLMADPKGRIIELPIQANFREGLTVTDYVISSYGARKGIVDTALRTADSGYLTRRLVDAAQHVIIREFDCHTKKGIRLAFNPKFKKRNCYIGRVLARPIFNKFKNEKLFKAGDTLTLEQISSLNFPSDIIVRSPLTCEAGRTICQKCYGWNLAQNKLVDLGEAIGVIAAQSIGEPGTQLTMRTFHTGGVFKGESSNQIRSQNFGQILFKADLDAVLIRTSYGEMVLKARNGSCIYILTNERNLIKIPIFMDMLIFVENKSRVKPNDLIVEIPNYNKQITKQIKTVRSSISGEIQFQNFKHHKKRGTIDSGLIWIASGSVYDIPSNILIRKLDSIIASNNAITQTKITLPLASIAKNTYSNWKSNFTFFSNLFVLSPNLVYQQHDSIWIYLKNRMFLTFDFELKKNRGLFKFFEQIKTRIYSINEPTELFYFNSELNSNNIINKFHTCLLKPFEENSESKILIPSIKKNPVKKYIDSRRPLTRNRKKLNCLLKDRILFPGEIFEIGLDNCNFSHSVYISSLSCYDIMPLSNAIKSNDLKYYPWYTKFILKFTPCAQFGVSNPSHYLLKSIFYFFNKFNFKFYTTLNFEKNKLLKSQTSFVEINVECPLIKNKLIKLNGKHIKSKQLRSQKIAFFGSYQNSLTISTNTKSTSYFISNNQYIPAYTIIATLNNAVTKRTKIKELKIGSSSPIRLLMTTSINYTSYEKANKKSNFLVVGDLIKNNHCSDFSGYIVPSAAPNNLSLRISKPYYISNGTVLLVNHGQLIKQSEAICQLISIRPINDDIISGLPRIEKLFEARLKKEPNKLIRNPGIVKFKQEDDDNGITSIVVIEKSKLNHYSISASLSLPIKIGQLVFVGQPIETRGFINPHMVLNTYFRYFCGFYSLKSATFRSFASIQTLLVNLIQRVYRSQGVHIADKHLEVIVKQMTSKVKISESGLLLFTIPSELFDFEAICHMNNARKAVGKELVEYEPILLGLTKVSLMSDSFISAASFQETTRMLIKAAIDGRVEWLRGLKENVILGRVIPAGTGFKSFSNSSFLNVKIKSPN